MKYFLVLFIILISFPVQADIFVWKDPKHKVSLTFGDDWMRQAVEGPDLRLHIVAPQNQDLASCRVFAHNDNRFLYVPAEGAVKVSGFVQDQTALKNVLANRLGYDNVNLIGYQPISTLGKGPATYAVGQFIKDVDGRRVGMQSILFGGYSHGLETVFQCESIIGGWSKWVPSFMAMAKTFDFPLRLFPYKQGYYRDFLADGHVFFPVGNGQGIAKY